MDTCSINCCKYMHSIDDELGALDVMHFCMFSFRPCFLDDPSYAANIINLCITNYNEETFSHCARVTKYALENVCLRSNVEREIASIIAMCHDLLEDTSVSVEDINKAIGCNCPLVINTLKALTKEKHEPYVEYIKRIKSNDYIYPYVVKLADMKDHLTQRETLTDRLKEKYWNALPYLL